MGNKPWHGRLLDHVKKSFILEWLFWKFMPGQIVSVQWPIGKVVVDPSSKNWDWALGATLQEIDSSDPNDHYRPWLEKHVGIQGIDWQWRLGMSLYGGDDPNKLDIKFRKGKTKYATIVALMWN